MFRDTRFELPAVGTRAIVNFETGPRAGGFIRGYGVIEMDTTTRVVAIVELDGFTRTPVARYVAAPMDTIAIEAV